MNRFTTNDNDPTINVATMVENYHYLDPKEWYASDVFFYQLMTAKNKDLQSSDLSDLNLLNHLPNKLPSQIVRDTIDNTETKEALNKIFCDKAIYDSNEEVFTYTVVGDADLNKIKGTPNGKTTVKILNDFNIIQKARNQARQEFGDVIVEKKGKDPKSGWKITFNIL